MMMRGLLIIIVCLVWGTPVHADVSTTSVSVIIAACNDGIDNDGDLEIDYPDDIGCTSAIDTDELNPACSDGVDNDLDTLIDYPADPGCTSALDTSEVDVIIEPSGGSSGDRVGTSIARTDVLATDESITFFGYTMPNGVVTILRDGTYVITTAADANGYFEHTFRALNAGSYMLGAFVYDQDSNRSPITNIAIRTNEITSALYIAPTLSVTDDRIEGYAFARGTVQIVINGESYVTTSDANGYYTFTIPDYSTEEDYTIYSMALVNGGRYTNPSYTVFLEGEVIEVDEDVCDVDVATAVDFNGDGQINLTDFSIAAYGFSQKQADVRFDLNCSGRVDLVDLSIMAYYWTG